MLDLNFATQNLDLVRARVRERGVDVDLDELVRLNDERKRLQTEISTLRHDHTESSKRIGALFKKGKKEEAEALRGELRAASDRIKEKEERQREAEEQCEKLLATLPNLAHESVPVGADDSSNVEVRRVGEPRNFPFDPRPHWELGESLGILDFDRAGKISGARFAVLSGMGARLERALINFMLDIHTREHGYREILPPFLVGAQALFGTGQLPKLEADLFKVRERDLYLVPTAEVPLTNLHREEILEADELPKLYTAYTPCFRSEAGSYGKDVRGLIRQHQFDKVELVKITEPESSYDELESLTADAAEILERLELPYRQVTLSSGDMGFSAAKTYDLEVWLPSQGTYREISSCSNCTDFQARRAGIRYRPSPGAKPRYCHTLNGSALAVGRTWLAILENFQDEDGSVAIPRALRPYLDDNERVSRAR
ncbi:MAG TPA: serine--tRNA ligase [Vicinamibacteria bacterium]|nr:serine--tRNA ligase [Vicinamibacteria bacterium]